MKSKGKTNERIGFMSQLKMRFEKKARGAIPACALPEGFAKVSLRAGDESAYLKLRESAGFDGWTRDNVTELMKSAIPDGVLLIVHGETGDFAATAAAQFDLSLPFPGNGVLGWVAAAPTYRGVGLGQIVCAAVMEKLLDNGYKTLSLLTDDWRLPAIKTYLKLGWIPCLHEPDMPGRWRSVCAELKIDYDKLDKFTPGEK